MIGIIYCAKNNINNKVYIGQTIKTLEGRKKKHIENTGNFHFHRALRKYDEWVWYIVQEYKCDADKIADALNKAEIYYINMYDSFNNGYNMTKGGEGLSGFNHSDKTKLKMSISGKGLKHNDERKRNNSEAQKGKTISEETRRKISESGKGLKRSEESKIRISLGQKGKIVSEETKAKISFAKKGKVSWMKGKKHTDEAKSKMSLARKGIKRGSYKIKVKEKE